MEINIGGGRGRPVKVLPKNNSFILRMTAEERALLDYLSEATDISKTDVVVHALRFYKTFMVDKR